MGMKRRTGVLATLLTLVVAAGGWAQDRFTDIVGPVSVGQVKPGSYKLVAGTDRDFDGFIDDDGETYGEWNGGAALEVTESRSDLSITSEPR